MTALAKTNESSSLGGGDTPVTPTEISVIELREGDELIYTDPNGNEIPCIVLYASKDSSGNNTTYYESTGIQIITKDLAKDSSGNNVTIELGNGTLNTSFSTNADYFSTAKASYNTAIATLNNAAKEYINTNLVTNARCVGVSRSETPITTESDTGTYTNSYSYFSSYNNQFKPSEGTINASTNEDWLKMNTLNCHVASYSYWLATRYVQSNSDNTSFGIGYMFGEGNYGTYKLMYVDSSKKKYSHSSAFGLRPVFLLRSDIHYTDDGTTKILVQ